LATLRKRNGKWQAQIRRVGHRPRAKSFVGRVEAQRWIGQTEIELNRLAVAHDHTSPERLTVADIFSRYKNEITPHKQGHAGEAKRIELIVREEKETPVS